jgi:hypothetical protein
MSEADNMGQPTPYSDVNAVLRDFLARIRPILYDRFTGMYVYGSLAQGDFDHATSDIDFIVVTERDVTAAQYGLLGAMHAQFGASDAYWAHKIEAAYIQKDALNLPSTYPATYPQLEKGRALAREPLEIGWPFQRYVLRSQGIVIAGPAPVTVMEPVAARELSAADMAILRMWQQQSRSDPSWLAWVRQRQEQYFFLVTLCRSLYTLEHGTLASKATAARWAGDTLDPKWAALIAHALMARDSAEMVVGEELATTLAFLDYTAQRLTEASTK